MQKREFLAGDGFMKSIAIFNTNIGIGGISTSLLNLLNSDIIKKYEVDLFLVDQKYMFNSKCVSKEIHVYCIERNYSNEKKYDIAIDYNGYSHRCAEYTLRTIAKKYIIWIHSDYFYRYRYNWKFKFLWQIMKKYYKDFDVLAFVSYGAKKGFEKIYKDNIKKTAVIPNMVNSAELLGKSKEQIDVKLDQNYHLVSVGALCKYKNVTAQINIFEAVNKKRKDIDLYIIGQGQEQKKLEKMVINKHLEQSIHFLGQKENPYAYMGRMDGLIVTSLYEGQGMVVREAQILGLDLFISENLKEYNEGIEISTDLIGDIINAAKRKTKEVDLLIEYNSDIEKRLEKILLK